MVLAELMWGVILADGELATHETWLVRKLAHLLELEPGYLSEARKAAAEGRPVSRDVLQTYLNDHLAGSVIAIELGERTIRENEGGPVAARLSPLVEQIREDQTVLKGVIERLGTGRARSRRPAPGWRRRRVG